MKLTAAHEFLPKTNSTRASMVMDHFGIDFEQGKHVIAENLEVNTEPGQIVLFTGESGSGKSSLMKSLREQLSADGSSTISLEELDLGNKILVDALDLPFQETLQLLSACGLGEAHLLLRTPQELSDGQRYRFSLAKALSQNADWIIADEFTATLDRTLAKVIALNLRKITDRTKAGFLFATTHEDIVADLSPDQHIHCELNGRIEIRDCDAPNSKKKDARLLTGSGSQKVPNPTGRISLGGITEATSSD